MKKTQKTLSSIIILSLILSCFSSMFAFGAEATDTTTQYAPSEAQMQDYINNSIANKLSDTTNTDLKSIEAQNSVQDNGGLTIVNRTYNSVTFSYSSASYPGFSVLIGGKSGESYQSYGDPNCTVGIEPFADYGFYVLDFIDYIYNPETGEVTWYPTDGGGVGVPGIPTISLTGSANGAGIWFGWTAECPEGTDFEYPSGSIQYDLYINEQLVTSTTDSGWGTLMYQPDFDHVGYVEAYPVDLPNNKVKSDTCTVHSNNLPDASPLTITATNITSNSVALSWTCDNPSVYDTYFVYNQTTGEYAFVYDQNYTATNLQPDTDYTFTVEGWYCSFTLYSTEKTVHTPSLTPLPAVTNLSAGISNNAMQINWNTVTGATQYEISINDDVFTSTSNLYTFSNIKLSRLYQIKVRAKNSSSASDWNTINLYNGKYGDINRDGMIDQKDVDLIAQYDAGLITLDPEQLVLADLDADGISNISDALLASQYVSKVITSFPVGVSTWFTNTNRPVKLLKYGDVTKDGLINQADIDCINLNIQTNAVLDKEQRILADVDGNGFINSTDKGLVNLYVRGYSTSFPLGTNAAFYVIPGYNVSGYVDVPVAVGSTVTLDGKSVTTDATGKFEFTGVENGVYNLQIAAKSALTRTIQVIVSGSNVTVSTSTNKIPLMFGDANHSGKIDISDQALIQGTYGATPSDPLYNINYDFDNSGRIDNDDLMTVQGWFNMTPEDYPEWTI